MGIVSLFHSLIKDMVLSEALKVQVSDLERQMGDLERDKQEAEERAYKAEHRAEQAERELAKGRAKENVFVEEAGVLIKRKIGGGYSETPYCPMCQVPMSSMDISLPFDCTRCGYTVSLTGRDFAIIINGLPP